MSIIPEDDLSDRLTNLSYVTLALIGTGGASAHDLVDMHRRGAELYYYVAVSKLYAEPKRLEKLGYVRSRVEPGKTRERTVYTLTRKGAAALRRFALQPPAPPRIQNEAIVKLISGDVVRDDRKLRDTLLTLRAELDDQAERLADARLRADDLSHRARYLALTHDLGERLVRAQLEWLDEVERELG
ncbi:MAG TPA: PadR family transcriptional regulator [Gaiellaceae bacterium]|nr:PadR family transcriptional regulator [Gaiellaceae bacterium]